MLLRGNSCFGKSLGCVGSVLPVLSLVFIFLLLLWELKVYSYNDKLYFWEECFWEEFTFPPCTMVLLCEWVVSAS